MSAYERARRDPTWGTFDRLIRAPDAVTELRVEPLADTALTIADRGHHLARASEDGRRRLVFDRPGSVVGAKSTGASRTSASHRCAGLRR